MLEQSASNAIRCAVKVRPSRSGIWAANSESGLMRRGTGTRVARAYDIARKLAKAWGLGSWRGRGRTNGLTITTRLTIMRHCVVAGPLSAARSRVWTQHDLARLRCVCCSAGATHGHLCVDHLGSELQPPSPLFSRWVGGSHESVMRGHFDESASLAPSASPGRNLLSASRRRAGVPAELCSGAM